MLLKKNNQHGLTLIELLISLVITSIVVTLCVNGFSFGNRVWDKVDAQQNYLDDIAIAQRFIRNVLNEAVFYPLNEGEAKNNYFSGGPEKVVFLAPSPQYGLDDYLYIYEIFKQKNGDGYNLSVRYLPANSYFSGIAATAKEDVILLHNAKDIKFRYYGSSNLTGEQKWHDSWSKQNLLPLLVSIQLESKTSVHNWPPLIVETKYGPYQLFGL